MIKEIIKRIRDFIYPPRCVLCGNVLSDRTDICNSCRANIRFCNENPITKSIMLSENILRYTFSVYSSFYYEGSIRRGILALKFKGRKKVAEFFSAFMANTARGYISDIDFVCCVPCSEKRIKKRGYNQSELLARSFCEKTGTIFLDDIIIKTKNNASQSSLKTKEERQRNVKDVFKINPDISLKNKNIILIDDVFTTGATLSVCCGLLIDAGANSVICLTAAAKRQ